MFVLTWAQPIGATEAAAIDPNTDCTTPIAPLPGKELETTDVTNALTNYAKYFHGDRYILCFQFAQPTTAVALSKPLLIAGKDKPLVIYGLRVAPLSFFLSSQPLLTVTGENVTLQKITVTGPGPDKAGTVGLKLSGTGHQVLYSHIHGFDTGIVADCAWPKDTLGNYGPSCTIGPANTIGDPSDSTEKKLVTIGVRVPATGQQVTVTQSSITTTADVAAAPDSVADEGGRGQCSELFSRDLRVEHRRDAPVVLNDFDGG